MNEIADNKNALITGGCGDIGLAAAQRLAQMGCRIAIFDCLETSAATQRLQSLRDAGCEYSYFPTDVTDRHAVEQSIEQVWNEFGALDLCLCNAGIVIDLPLVEFTGEQWQRHLDVNLTGYFHVCQLVSRRWIAEKRKGRFIFTGSWVQDEPYKDIAPYCVSKAGVWMLARCAALELAPHGITVNVVAPGIVDAGLSAQEMREDPALREEFNRIIPLGRLQEADDVAAVIGFLASPAASYLTGTSVLCDGGCTVGAASVYGRN
jgi:NAD(P)-dependent dehydrogenase (short-subunit alcohol dehydrogenase family)